jgi:hypothetical protein
MGQIYEAYGAFEGALAVYQQIVTTLSFYPKYTEVREAYIGILNLTQAYSIKETTCLACIAPWLACAAVVLITTS